MAVSRQKRQENSLRLSVLSSGSSGNAAYIESGEAGVLIDAGLSHRRLKLLLARIGRSFEDVGAILAAALGKAASAAPS